MTTAQRDKAIQTGQLQLGWYEKYKHFSIVLLLCLPAVMIPIFHLIAYLQGQDTSFKEGEIWVIIIPSIVAVLFYWLQKSRLKFKIIDTRLKWISIFEIAESVGTELKWTDMDSGNRIFTAKTAPGFWSGSWGEQITVLYDDGRVFINSICDLEKRASVSSMGRNRKNMEVLMERIKQAGMYGME